jgi:hypothetical protein
MKIWCSVLMLAALIGRATAAIVPPPLNATVINFDDVTVPPDTSMIPGPLTDEYIALGIRFRGFGESGGAIVNQDSNFGFPAVSPPNFLGFASIITMQNGGILQSPETLTFSPPIISLQFDVFGLGPDLCGDDEVLTVEAFDPSGTSVAMVTQVVGEPTTVQMTFPPTGVERVLFTSTHTCGDSLFKGVEAFTLDNVAFVGVGSEASRCAQVGLKAAGKKAKSLAKCYSLAVQKGAPLDPECVAKADETFTNAFAGAVKRGDCLTTSDAPSVETIVDAFAANLNTEVTGGAPGPDVCDALKLKKGGVKAMNVAKCYATAAHDGAVADEACIEKAAQTFTKSLKKCGTQPQLDPLEALIDAFVQEVSRALTVVTTTTTTVTTSTTTSTVAPPLGAHLLFTTTAGTDDCTANPPFSGEVDSDVAGTTLVKSLGLGCLFIGGGNANIPPSRIPENASSIFDSPDNTTLVASFGTGPRDCSRGPSATRHCVNDPSVECTSDGECAMAPGGCAFDANCFFGPPVPVNGFPQSCVVNTFAADGSGTIDLATGTSSVNIQLASRVYLTLTAPSACPQCIDGVCNFGENKNGDCATSNVNLTSFDCPPSNGSFIATLPVNLGPLSTGPSVVTAADGLFCPDQANAGAFGEPTAQAIKQTGTPSGDLTDGLPHPSVLVSNFCIPATQNLALDNLGDLPGPGSLSLPGTAQFITPSSPSGAFVD